MFLIAFIIRIPYLYDVPRFIDEWREIGLSAQIARGEAWPLHNTSHDIGPFHNYVLAGLFKVFGFNVYIPRLYVAVTSAATVVVTYWLVRHWSDRVTATIASLLLATNSMHILVTHMAWSNDTTPFFVCLALLLLVKALDHEKRAFGLWALTGITWAIAFQTHPSVIAAIVGVMFYLTGKFGWRAFYRDPRFRIGIVTFLVGYSNLIIHNILKPFDSILWVRRKDYALNQEWSVLGYIDNLREMGIELVHSLASAFPDGEGWLHGISLFFMLFVILGLVDGFRRLNQMNHGALLIMMVISSFFIIPVLNDQYKFYVWTRYIAYLLPLCFVGVAIGFHSWIKYVAHRMNTLYRSLQFRSLLSVASAIIFILPLHHFYQYAESYIQSGQDNSAEFSVIKSMESKTGEEMIVAVDKQVKQAEAVSKMLRVKGFTSPLVGIDPNEVREVQANSTNLEKGIDPTFYSKWKKAFSQNKPHTWYVLSLSNKDKLTSLFRVTWAEGEVIHGENGQQTYFIGRMASYND